MKQLYLVVVAFAFLAGCQQRTKVENYSGKSYYQVGLITKPQVVPGRIECEFYDFGGEGIAYHDSDSINSGSGNLNPANSKFLNEFRINESVDISYTKPNGIDDNPFNFVIPTMEQLYVGWTEPGEWLKYTIEVMESGTYHIGMMFTSNKGGVVGLIANNNSDTIKLSIPSTYVEADTLGFRQWHHWDYKQKLGEITLIKGANLLTIITLENGQMNYNYIDFELISK